MGRMEQIVAQGCDLLILPSSPDAPALSAMLQMVEALYSLSSNYCILPGGVTTPPETQTE
jgi:chromosome partitioning protein